VPPACGYAGTRGESRGDGGFMAAAAAMKPPSPLHRLGKLLGAGLGSLTTFLGLGMVGWAWGHTFAAGDIWTPFLGEPIMGPPFGLIGRQHHVMQEKRMWTRTTVVQVRD